MVCSKLYIRGAIYQLAIESYTSGCFIRLNLSSGILSERLDISSFKIAYGKMLNPSSGISSERLDISLFKIAYIKMLVLLIGIIHLDSAYQVALQSRELYINLSRIGCIRQFAIYQLIGKVTLYLLII